MTTLPLPQLETRFVDGTVQGKYGYIDANGDVKIIEYGADAMGFQPEGDLPEGIVIPPPVQGNCTDCTYDYDYEEVGGAEEARRAAVSRARGSTSDQTVSRVEGRVNQGRGQQLAQPLTPAPLPRQPQPARSRPAPPPPQPFQPTPIPAQPVRVRGGSRARGAVQRQRGSSGRSPAGRPAPQTAATPSRPAPPPPAPATRPSPPQKTGEFANFPSRGGAASAGRPAVSGRTRNRQRLGQQQQQRPAAPAFSSFIPNQQTIQPAFASSPAAPPPRPALTFQAPQPRPAPPANLPKSALEVVDFNQLLQEFQGRQSSGVPPAPRRFAAQPAVPPAPSAPRVFQSPNFPARF